MLLAEIGNMFKCRKADIFPFPSVLFNYVQRVEPLRKTLKTYRAISGVNVEFKTNVSEVFSVSIIRVDVVNGVTDR
jgi:hypothetical protein